MKLNGTIEERIIHSDALDEDMKLLVYLPPSYTPLLRYSVLIAQDGDDYFKLGRIARTTEELIEDAEIEQFIIIGIPYKDVKDRRRKYHPEGEQNEQYIRFLVRELVPYIEDEFSTLELSNSRGLIGDSLGATVSLMAALSYPRTFGKLVLQSPYVGEEVLEAVENFHNPSLLSIYHVAGTQETEVETTNGAIQNFIEPNRKLNERFESRPFNYKYCEFEGNHTWKYWQSDIPHALKWMFPL